MKRHASSGFTLVELLVVIAIIGILIAMLLPALQQARELGRRAQCANNLTQLGIALATYQGSFEQLPAGTVNPTGPIANRPPGEHISWIVRLLPNLDQRNTYRAFDLQQSIYAPVNRPPRSVSISTLLCPSSWNPGGGGGALAVSDYAGCHHDLEQPIDVTNRGVLYLNSAVRNDDIGDGASHTIFVGEKLAEIDDTGAFDLGWASGTRATLRNTGTRLNSGGGAMQQSAYPPVDWVELEDRLALGQDIAEPRSDFEVMPLDKDDAPTAPANPTLESADPPATDNPTDTKTTSDKPEVAAPAEAAKAIDDGGYPLQRGPLWVGGFASAHTGGANFLFGDGSVKFLTDQIDLQVYRRLGNRDDGQLLSDSDY